MADFAAAQQLMARYCWAHDEHDLELLGQCFTNDVEMMGRKGRDDLLDLFRMGYEGTHVKRRHVVTNMFFEEENESDAVLRSYITLYMIENDVISLHLTCMYRDTIVLEDGAWRIRARDAQPDVTYRPTDVSKELMAEASGQRQQ
jgi:hypothetical protein